ncbi:TetR/AcrR family transcriptional regulator [Micromonospora sp. WMMD812]|uniref:TetR/AcrR family transcriptional regulator n=1 Tax=Micromonospora sp. WMMD812 TaxID=3015152 RepID=UPI00248AED7E|nr:TetR/AcrR family transcriptional regulator [Micromonospora sp. WMMD812]WBB67536.1 TetR/AcrR family transcriptional regulator [Micromonospora sp. WMMD812]
MSEPADAGAERDLIVAVARRLAEAEGWAAVSPRRLAERADLTVAEVYRHFADREAIAAAVAVRGFAELAATIAAARTPGADRARGAWPGVVTAYLDFAYANPEVYDAMLAHTPDLTLGAVPVPAAPQAAFAELRATLAPLAGGRDVDVLAEVGWSVLHGVVMLTRGGRLRPAGQEEREAMIAESLFDRS